MKLLTRYSASTLFCFFAILFNVYASSDTAKIDSCDKVMTLDAKIIQSLTELRNPTLIAISKGVSNSLVPISIAVPTIHVAYGQFSNSRDLTINGLLIAGAETLQFGLMTGVKAIVQRKRPFVAYSDCIKPNDTESFWSFPSGHAGGSACLATILSLRYPHWVVIAPSVAFTLYTSFARMHLGVHYPSDVFVGTLLGVGSAIIVNSFAADLEKLLYPNSDTGSVIPTQQNVPVFSLSLPL